MQKLDGTQHVVKDLVSKQRNAELRHWLSPPIPSVNYNKALQQRHAGTGSWFLQSDAFTALKSRKTSFLWLYGIPGCGKTVLSSTIIEHLQSLSIEHLLYFYFDFNDAMKQTLRGLVTSLIMQLYCTCTSARELLDGFFSLHKHTQPSCESLSKVLHSMIEQAEEIWIVIDALDECTERKGEPTKGLLSWMQNLMKVHDNVRCLVTSRPEQEIQMKLNRLTSRKHRIPIQSNLVNGDIAKYIRAKVEKGEELRRWRNHPDVQKEIKQKLMKKSQGM